MVQLYAASAEDIRSFYEYGEKYAASSDDIFEYTIERTSKTLDKNYEEAYNDFKETYKTTVLDMSFEGKIDIDIDGFHETMKILSEKYNLNYLRRRKDGN